MNSILKTSVLLGAVLALGLTAFAAEIKSPRDLATGQATGRKGTKTGAKQTAGFQSTTQPHADGLVLERKSKPGVPKKGGAAQKVAKKR